MTTPEKNESTTVTPEIAKLAVLKMITDFAIWFYTNYIARQWDTPFDKNRAKKEIYNFVKENREALIWDYNNITFEMYEAFQEWLASTEDRYAAYYYEHTNKLFLEILKLLAKERWELVEDAKSKVTRKVNRVHGKIIPK